MHTLGLGQQMGVAHSQGFKYDGLINRLLEEW